MERLTEKVFGFVQLKACGNDFCKETCAEHDEEKSCKNCHIQKAFEKLAEYEDLEEQGLLLRLPCKVGDTVYRIENGKITQTKITKYDIYADGSIWFSFSTSLSLPMSKFKTCIFFTQAEAEQKLKEMESD